MQDWSEAEKGFQEAAAMPVIGNERAVVLKGLGLERDSVTKLDQSALVNDVHIQPEWEQNQSCQERVDTKAFTGRGSRHELRQLTVEVDSLEQRMRALSAASKAVPGAEIYLMVHQRHATGYTFLRWRESAGNKRHLSWAQGEALYQRYAEPLRSWYVELVQQAVEINAQHLAARKQVRMLQESLQRKGMQLYARPVPP